MGTLLFLLTVLLLVAGVVLIVYRLARRQFAPARTTALVVAGVIGLYFAALVITSLTSQSAALPLNQNKCFDEWCAAITNIVPARAADGNQDYVVTVRISNTGRGRAQRPDTPRVYLVDAGQTAYDVSPAAQSAFQSRNGPQPALNQLIQAGTSFTTSMVFRLPAQAKANVVITEGGWPTYLIIGDEGSLWHRQSLTPVN
jgi:hypothetical protein